MPHPSKSPFKRRPSEMIDYVMNGVFKDSIGGYVVGGDYLAQAYIELDGELFEVRVQRRSAQDIHESFGTPLEELPK